MLPFSKEAAVSLEHLDERLKAILKFKLREFVHLHPLFRGIPTLDPKKFEKTPEPLSSALARLSDHCPNRDRHLRLRRRAYRGAWG